MQEPPKREIRSTPFWWVGTAFQLLGVFALAARQADPQLCYGVMLVGSLSGIAAALLDRNRALVLLNLGYTLSNIIGISQW